jgi:hypothetical protein
MLPVLLATLAAAVPTVDCSTHVEASGATAEDRRAAIAQSVVVDGTIFWGLRRAERLTFGGRRKGHKAGISVRHGARLTVKLAARDRDWLALDYAAAASASTTHFVPCAPDTPRFSDDGVVGDETAWAGGFDVKRDGCATLLLRREGEERWRKVRVGFGRRCR